MRYAIVRDKTVENVIELIEGAQWEPPPGTALHPADDSPVSPGWGFRDGAFVDPSPPPPPAALVPLSATSGDFMRALIELDWYDAAKTAVDKLAAGGAKEGKLARVLWDRASIFRRDDPMVASIAAGIGKTDADLDALYRLTATY